MTVQQLRNAYPRFTYEKYDYRNVNDNLEINYYYSISSDIRFIHKLIIGNCSLNIENSDDIIFNVGLSLIPSYWKASCSPIIDIRAGSLNQDQIRFWKKLYIKGMGEYFYKNQIDFTPEDFLLIINGEQMEASQTSHAAGRRDPERTAVEHVAAEMPNQRSRKVLVPVGGGKDSIVTLELLKPHYTIIPFVINPVPVINNVIQIANVGTQINVSSLIDPRLLELNDKGFLNGHVPVSAFYAFCAVLVANINAVPYIAFSNERSSNEGNTTYLGHEINHQYSKTLEFETDMNTYLINNLHLNISYFSFLRPLYELQITKLFSDYPAYFSVFSSCNSNFKLASSSHSLWCGACPKCVSTALMLACFIGKDGVTKIMGTYPPDLPENNNIINDILGNNAVKPFECILTRDEAHAAIMSVNSNQTDSLQKLLTSWIANPNLPSEFEQILKKSL